MCRKGTFFAMFPFFRHAFRPAKPWFLVFLLVFIQLALLNRVFWDRHPPGMIGPVFTVAALDSELVHTRLSPYGPGLEKELVLQYAAYSGTHPIWVHLKQRDAAWNQLRAGQADLLVGAADAPGSDVTRLPYQAEVISGPIFATHPVGVVHQRRYHGLEQVSDLCHRPVLVPSHQILRTTFKEISSALECTPKSIPTAHDSLPSRLAVMQEQETRFTLVDTGQFRLWEPFFMDFELSGQVKASIAHRWFWRGDESRLHASLNNFWQKIIASNEFARLEDRYQGFLPESNDRFALVHFLKTLREKLPRYSTTIATAARRHDIDPLLLTALIYHESGFELDAVSRTGVRGIMQITQSTAENLGLDDPFDPEQSILAGARYLRQIWERLERPENPPMGEWDRWFLALSAYNQGLGHTWDAMALARNLGLDETSWRDVKNVFPLLSQREYFTQARHGYTRGFEAVAHVDAVRYYYYVLHGLFALDRLEGKHFARLGFGIGGLFS